METILNYLDSRVGIISLLVGIVLLILSFIMYKFPPKKINIFYGYRTPSSMQSQETWDFAQRYSTFGMFLLGIIMLIIASVNLFVKINQGISTIIGMAVMISGLAIMIFMTERAIKKNFPKK